MLFNVITVWDSISSSKTTKNFHNRVISKRLESSLCTYISAILSQDSLSPGPIAYLISGSNVTFTCITSNDWNLTYFYDYGLMEENFARVIYQRNSTICRPLFIDTHIGEDKYTALPCSVGQPVSITIRYINSSYHNKTIACRPDQGKLITTTVKIREMLTSPEIDPRGVSTIEDGTVASFKCTAKSIPKSSIEWYISGSKLNDTVTTVNATENTVVSTIMYLAKKEHNNKILFCSANDSFTAINSSSTTLNIEYVPTVHIDPGFNPYIVYAGQQNVTLACVVDDANPADSIHFQWTNLVGISSDQTIILANISNIHSGEYRCKAENKVGNSSVSSKLLKVQYGPQLSNIVNQYDIIEGDNLIVSPMVDSTPVHGLIWWTKQNDTNFRHDSFVLKINQINRTSSDNYTCYVMNTITPSGMAKMNKTTQKTFYVSVQFKPFADFNSQYSSLHITAKEGGTLLLTVTITANPTPNIEWRFQAESEFGSCNFSTLLSNTTTNGFRTSSITAFDSVHISNFGDYTFTAKNLAGNFVRRFFVTEEVNVIPPSLEYVVCKSTTAIVMWKQISNGDRSWEFYVQYGENGRNMKSKKLQHDNTNQLMTYKVNGLNPNRKYTFSIRAVNLLTESKSRTVECLTDVACSNKETCDPVKEQPVMFQVGLSMLVVGLLFLTFVTVFVVCNSKYIVLR
ncbi:Hypothetical predicted protein [Mytilus galloprovincialis]|uniref:Uncharacterized protein n=1 Tax=Mytilus galloprovincialis TaxID=29158 RepID=A0A8B6GF23_MYTGA|nr:Hypothetical predicted protein [Mytilus galloprovincialis]